MMPVWLVSVSPRMSILSFLWLFEMVGELWRGLGCPRRLLFFFCAIPKERTLQRDSPALGMQTSRRLFPALLGGGKLPGCRCIIGSWNVCRPPNKTKMGSWPNSWLWPLHLPLFLAMICFTTWKLKPHTTNPDQRLSWLMVVGRKENHWEDVVLYRFFTFSKSNNVNHLLTTNWPLCADS